MKYKPIIIVAGEPNSIFSEIFFKVLKKNKFKSPIILICSYKLLLKQAKTLKAKIDFNLMNIKKIKQNDYRLKKINLINVDYNQSKPFEKISPKSNNYISKCFNIGLELIKLKISDKFINGPISKENFLKKKFNGITEYLAYKTKTKNFAMIIYNKKLSVSPITTHIPIKYVAKNLNKQKIINQAKLLNKFWLMQFESKAKIGITALNPHCESKDKFKEDKRIILPAVSILKKLNINIEGPFPADTLFRRAVGGEFDIVVAMYHDQGLIPLKLLGQGTAVNWTVGLPFIRTSPDHGTAFDIAGRGQADASSMKAAIALAIRLATRTETTSEVRSH